MDEKKTQIFFKAAEFYSFGNMEYISSDPRLSHFIRPVNSMTLYMAWPSTHPKSAMIVVKHVSEGPFRCSSQWAFYLSIKENTSCNAYSVGDANFNHESTCVQRKWYMLPELCVHSPK